MSSPVECEFLDLDTLALGQVLDIEVYVGGGMAVPRPCQLFKTNRFPSKGQRRFKAVNGIYHEVMDSNGRELNTNPTFNFFMIQGTDYSRSLVRPSRIIKVNELWFDGVNMTHVHSITDHR